MVRVMHADQTTPPASQNEPNGDRSYRLFAKAFSGDSRLCEPERERARQLALARQACPLA